MTGPGNFINLQELKINNLSGNASINPGDANITGSSIYRKSVGVNFAIGDFSSSNSVHSNMYYDPDLSDQNSGQSPTSSSQI